MEGAQIFVPTPCYSPGTHVLAPQLRSWGKWHGFPKNVAPEMPGDMMCLQHMWGCSEGPSALPVCVETPPQLTPPCQNKQAGCTLPPQGTEEKGIPRLVFGSGMFVLLLEGRRVFQEGSCLHDLPPPPAAMAETAALAESNALGGMHQLREAHPLCTPAVFQGRAVTWLLPSSAAGARP